MSPFWNRKPNTCPGNVASSTMTCIVCVPLRSSCFICATRLASEVNRENWDSVSPSALSDLSDDAFAFTKRPATRLVARFRRARLLRTPWNVWPPRTKANGVAMVLDAGARARRRVTSCEVGNISISRVRFSKISTRNVGTVLMRSRLFPHTSRRVRALNARA